MDDSNCHPLEALAAQGYPLFIPWTGDDISLGAGFDSSYITSKLRTPWTKSSAFQLSNNAQLSFDLDGGVASFREGTSSASKQSSEHLSASLGVTVGCRFLSGNVTGSFDRSVSKNTAGTRVSKNASCRIGMARFKSDPKLTTIARQTLETSKNSFRDTFGDYFVAGYQLGADAGACATVAHFDQSEEEQARITATIKVLWIKKSVTTSTSSRSQKSEDYITFCGYDTLQQQNTETSGRDIWRIQQLSSAYMGRIDNLQLHVHRKLRDMGYMSGKNLGIEACTALHRSGLVVQLMLLPYVKLPEVLVLAESLEV